MFRDYLYLDKNRINKYYKQICGVIPNKEKKLIEKNANLDTSAGVKFEKVNGNQTKSKQIDIGISYETEDVLQLFEQKLQKFEQKLQKEDKSKFFDLYDEGIDIDTISKGAIVKFEGKLEVPHEFDEIDFIKKVLNNPKTSDYFIKDIINNNSSDEELFKVLLKEGGEIPIYFSLNDLILYSNIKSENLTVRYDEFESYIEDDVTVIAKVEKCHAKGKIKIYDKYKELFKINRAMRREIEDNDGDIYVDGPGKKISIIAIYT